MNTKESLSLFGRYGLILILAIGNLKILYYMFTPLTIYPVEWILSLMGEVYRVDMSNLVFEGITISIIPACVSGAAYYLLAILNLSTPMEKTKRVKSIAFLGGTFLIINIIRIVFFVLISQTKWFEVAHMGVWYFGSTAMVVLIWFANTKIFGINEIPIVSDIGMMMREVNNKKNKKVLKQRRRGNE